MKHKYKTMIYNFIRLFICLTLVIQTGHSAGPSSNVSNASGYLIDSNTGIPQSTELEKLIRTVEKTDLRNPKFLGADPDLLVKQVHYVIAKDGSVQEQYQLSKIDVNNPTIGFTAGEIQFRYLPEKRMLVVEKFVNEKGPDGKPIRRVTNVHAYLDIEITSNIIHDSNFIAFATAEGVRVILKSVLYEGLFASSAPAPIVVPLPSVKGAKITNLEYLTEHSSEPRVVYNADRASIKNGDLAVTVELENGQKTESVITRDELILSIRQRLGLSYALMQIANGNLEGTAAPHFLQIMNENAQEIAAAGQAIADSDRSEEIRASYTNIGQRNAAKVIDTLLTPDKQSGLDSFQALTNSTRHQFSPDVSEDSRWQKSRKAVREARQKGEDKTESGFTMSDRDVLVRSLQNSLATTTQTVAERVPTSALSKKLLSVKNSRFMKNVKPYFTKKRMAILAAVLAGYAVNDFTDGAMKTAIINVASKMIESGNKVPVVNLVTQSLTDSNGQALEFFRKSWATTRVAIGCGIVLMYYPLSLWAGKMYAKVKSMDVPAVNAFFTAGIRLYGAINYPIQKILWEYVGRQKNLYKALDANHLSTQAFRLPFTSTKRIADATERMNSEIDEKAKVKMKAQIVAARIVSERHGIDLATLLMVNFGKQVSTLAELLSSPIEVERWTQLTTLSRTALAEIQLNSESVDPESIKQYEAELERVVSQIRTEASRNPSKSKKTLEALSVKGKAFGEWVTRFFVFGTPGLRLSRQFKTATVDDVTAAIALPNYRDDYIMSSLFYALADGQGFGDIAALGPRSPEILFNQGEQVFIYGMQGPVDPLSAATSSKLVAPEDYAPIADDVYAHKREREQTLKQASTEIAHDMLDPNTPSAFANHQQYLINLLEGFQVRALVGGALRMLGLWGTVTAAAAVAGTAPPSLFTVFTTAFVIQSWFLFDKMSFHITPDGGLRPGYALIWSYIHHAMRSMINVVNGNASAIKFADYKLDTGLKFGVTQNIIEGVQLTLENFRRAKVQLPDKFNISPDAYSISLASELLEHSRTTPSLPTKSSEAMSSALNKFSGALISTALYTVLSQTAYNPNNLDVVSNLGILYNTLIAFSASYVGLGALSKVSPTLLRGVHKAKDKVKAVKVRIKESCARLLSRKSN